jgi:hypothetical protein
MEGSYRITELSSRLNKACYALRALKPFMSTDVMKSIYYSYVHSILAYGIIFWGNSWFSDNIFRIQKRIIRVITNSRKRYSCRELLKNYKYWHFSLNIFSHFLSLLSKIADIHDINTRFNQNLHLPSTNLTLVQKGVFFSGRKIYNQLPLRIKMLCKDIKHFKSSLRTYLIEHAFYSIDEYYQLTS